MSAARKKSPAPSTPRSEVLSAFLVSVEQFRKDYKTANDDLEAANNELCDHEHRLELEDLDYKKKAQIAGEVSETLRKRRAAKDAIETLKPICDFYADPRNKSFFDALRNILGDMRKIEKRNEVRYYTFKARNGILRDGKIEEGN